MFDIRMPLCAASKYNKYNNRITVNSSSSKVPTLQSSITSASHLKVRYYWRNASRWTSLDVSCVHLSKDRSSRDKHVDAYLSGVIGCSLVSGATAELHPSG